LVLNHSTAFVESNDPGEDRYTNHPPGLPPAIPLLDPTATVKKEGGGKSDRPFSSSSTKDTGLSSQPSPSSRLTRQARGKGGREGREGGREGGREDVGIYIILDGHGGGRASEYMSQVRQGGGGEGGKEGMCSHYFLKHF